MIILNDVFYIWFGFKFNRNLKKKKEYIYVMYLLKNIWNDLNLDVK